MKQTMQKIAIALCMALAFAACKNDDPETGGGVESITIDKNELSLVVNGSETLKASINGVVSTEVKWGSSNKAVATVDDNGKVTAKKEGTAKITATAKADATKTATCSVTVVDKTEVLPSGVTLNKNGLSLEVGDTETLTATITNASDVKDEYKKITWTSSNAGVAAVDNNGKVTAVRAGTATITAKTTNGIDATCTVTVNVPATTPVAASDDEWNFVGKTDTLYSNLGTPKSNGSGKDAQTLDNDISVKGDKNQLTLVLSKTSTDVGLTKTAPKYKYDSTSGLCIKGAALKIDGIKGSVTATIEWYLSDSDDRNLEVTVNGKTIATPSGTATDGKTPYTVNFDAGDGTTLYIGASNELYIKSITVTPQSGGGTVTPNPDPDPTPDPDPSDKTISLTDKVLGYASLGTSYKTSGGTTVANRSDLLSAISKGGVIIIDGMIDMSEGKLPAEGTRTDADMTGFDAFVSENSTYTSYKALRDAYVARCSSSTNDKNSDNPESSVGKTLWSLNKTYGELIKLNLQSNTTLIGKGANCGIRGGSIQISSKSNIQIRNLTIKDAFDPFPHHEKDDGYNAQWDGINIQGASKNIWIDHCTLMDTCTLGFVKTGGSEDEKWQVYDGLCDIKGNSEYITVSNCKFYQHDKTMLIGNDDVEGLTVTRTITLYRNYFFNCGQRLPMVRNSNIHILNNYYDYDGTWYLKDGQQYAIGVRANANVYSENNYFGDKISYSVSGTADKTQGTLYRTGDSGKTTVKSGQFKTSDTPLFTPSYTLDKLEASAVPNSVKASAGAGYTLK